MANKEKDKKSKVAPPRSSDASRMANFMSQTGLGASIPGSAAARRRQPTGAPRKGGRK